MEDGVENLHVELLHGQQLLLGLVEGQRAGVHPPQARPGDDWWERWGQVTAALVILNTTVLEENNYGELLTVLIFIRNRFKIIL